MAAIEKAGYRPGEQIALALDAAASELGGESAGAFRYALAGEGKQGLSADDLIALYAEWCSAYPLVSIEDGLAEGDWTAAAPEPRARRARAAGRRRHLRHQPRDPPPRHRAGGRQRAPGQGQPDRHPDRDARGGRPGALGGWANVISHRSGETRTPPSPISRSPRAAARSRPAPPAAATGWPSTTGCCVSRRSSRGGGLPGPRRLPAIPRVTVAAQADSARPPTVRSLLSALLVFLVLVLATAALKGWRDLQKATAREADLRARVERRDCGSTPCASASRTSRRIPPPSNGWRAASSGWSSPATS